jgi:hypothetical protein
MGVMGPQDVRAIMDMLESIQEAEAAKKMPPGSHDRALAEVEYQFEGSGSPPGRSANQGFTGRIGNPDPVRAPWRGERDLPGNFERSQHMADSMANDAMLREVLGYKRGRTEDDDVEGTFALARYPGIESAIWGAEAGLAPRGYSGGGLSPEQQGAQRRWARKQREILGMDRRIGREEHRGFQRAMKGQGAKQRAAAFRRFLGG